MSGPYKFGRRTPTGGSRSVGRPSTLFGSKTSKRKPLADSIVRSSKSTSSTKVTTLTLPASITKSLTTGVRRFGKVR